jgi:ATP-dependent Clp protease ATP-binding subunit ClpC
MTTDDYMFLERRFNLSKEIASSASASSVHDWWDAAKALWQKIPNPEGIDSAHTIVAILLSSENKQAVFTSMKTTEKDIVQGLEWLMYWKEMYKTVHARRTKGGIARDWATGYTPTLNRFAYNISQDIQYGGSYHRNVFGHKQIINQMSSALIQAGRSNIILVGDAGVGKTTCIDAFADSLLFEVDANYPLRFHQVYSVDTASMLSQINDQNHLENTLNLIANEAYKAKNIILYFSDITNLFGIEGGIDIYSTMLPIVKNGGVKIIFSATEGQWKWLQQNKPELAALINFQAVTPPSESDTMRIIENKAILIEQQFKCQFTYNSLKEIYRLSSRYGPELAMPAKAINVMETVARINSGTMITRESVALAIEQTTGIKTGSVGDSEKNTLLALDSILHQKVIGQEEAIATIVSALQRSRAGVSNQNKPIGTFLLLGPTGVGKTETAKAIAATYFGGEDRLIRIDMNEFVTRESVTRLLESGSTSSSSLLDSVRKQPFSVVLFDEIEKAHPDAVNSLLQMLDEGIMRDVSNKTVSFRDSIVIATSNAGAEHISKYEEVFANDPNTAKQKFIDQLINSGSFRPEFINRFDNVVVYRPLSPVQLESVVDIQMLRINDTLAPQQLSATLTPEARSWLAKKGYDPMMGARPLRRLMQQTVENAISRKILENTVQSGSGQNIIIDENDLTN